MLRQTQFNKTQILNILRKFTISVTFYRKLAKFDEKIIQTREQPMLARLRKLNWQTSGNKADLFERKILLSYS